MDVCIAVSRQSLDIHNFLRMKRDSSPPETSKSGEFEGIGITSSLELSTKKSYTSPLAPPITFCDYELCFVPFFHYAVTFCHYVVTVCHYVTFCHYVVTSCDYVV